MSEEFMVSIEKLVYGGDGLAHEGERTVFVPFVLPGEQVRVALKSQKKRTAWATPIEIVKAAENRVTPKCSHFKVCGGCQYQHIDSLTQAGFKQEILRETLSRLGGIHWDAEIKTHAAAPFEYRNRAQWAVRSAMPRAMGYFLPESSNVVPIDECPVLSPLLAKSFRQLQDLTRSNSVAPRGIATTPSQATSPLGTANATRRPPGNPANIAAPRENRHARERTV
jgi:23S rRNA (uracil1939-C5)-methyltransferase